MLNYYLFVVVFGYATIGYGSHSSYPPSISIVPFGSKEACELAVKDVKTNFNSSIEFQGRNAVVFCSKEIK